ncbi:thiamine phosphate synthase [Rhodoblastus acidophilus]|uniref:Thiamine phosphate synthase n=1 Tax=Candidatus Rhodoblastus alkanivorans TaxID=2954117 RepID=A0ABS9Z2Z1_9HYPH|nr:thiamine phosphate synthase [Candidatus Rhodoblastus alkanivorans]MCI4677283.1 thiamine phosphate synthase [Candidatus Rhodoblastus alkanivorans]MCI4682018.1 thiamine phosphate synthase [Candidatus Rhodoblastus alkanivorans]MDI4643069.1 thiamine phosphate synthase [Rhodoblastus acidophilus]
MNDFIKPRLYLITPPAAEADAVAPAVEAALGAGDVACVLLRFAILDEGARKKIVKALAPMVQGAGAALLVPDDAALAARAGADGVHVEGFGDNFAAALESLKPERIVGIGALASRDEAMLAGESDADYLMFGALDPGADSAAATAERASWWAELFNVPCVAVAHETADVETLARSGAEFVALGPKFFADPRGIAAAVAEAQAALDRVEAKA